MPNRANDWMRQAERDREQAEASRQQDRHEWACFAAHQAAEKALKAVYAARNEEAWGHLVAQLVADVPTGERLGESLAEKGRVLDNYYIPTRYPNGHADGAPFEHYGPLQSEQAIDCADAILQFARDALARPG